VEACPFLCSSKERGERKDVGIATRGRENTVLRFAAIEETDPQSLAEAPQSQSRIDSPPRTACDSEGSDFSAQHLLGGVEIDGGEQPEPRRSRIDGCVGRETNQVCLPAVCECTEVGGRFQPERKELHGSSEADGSTQFSRKRRKTRGIRSSSHDISVVADLSQRRINLFPLLGYCFTLSRKPFHHDFGLVGSIRTGVRSPMSVIFGDHLDFDSPMGRLRCRYFYHCASPWGIVVRKRYWFNIV
jgi:hypothetical protein